MLAVNTAYPRVRPDVWVGMDTPACYDPRLWWEPFPKIVRGPYLDETCGGVKIRKLPQVFFADVERAYATDLFRRRSHDATFVWNGNTFVVALHLAVWMGAKRIHLVGCDFGAKEVLLRPHRGDQEALDAIRDRIGPRLVVMPRHYQRLRLYFQHEDALVTHWTGAEGKAKISEMTAVIRATCLPIAVKGTLRRRRSRAVIHSIVPTVASCASSVASIPLPSDESCPSPVASTRSPTPSKTS